MGSLQKTMADEEKECKQETTEGVDAGQPRTRTWKQVVDEKLQRLHSLQFGADLALDKGDAETALALGLCLLGFLESECHTPDDRTVIAPIIEDTKQRIDAARDIAAPSLDRCAFEQVNGYKNNIFKKSAGVDFNKIKQSKYFLPYTSSHLKADEHKSVDVKCDPSVSRPVLSKGEGKATQQGCLLAGKTTKSISLKSEASGESSPKVCRNLTQAKLTSLYGNGNGNAKPSAGPSRNSSGIPQKQAAEEDQIKVLKSLNAMGSRASPVFVVEEEENTYGSLRKRRKAFHSEESSCVSRGAESGAVGDGNEQESRASGFVTAKHKWAMESIQKRGSGAAQVQTSSSGFAGPSPASYSSNNNRQRSNVPKMLGMSRRGVRGNFVPPVRSNGGGAGYATTPRGAAEGLEESTRRCLELLVGPDGELPDKLKNVEPKLIEHISNEIMDQDPNVRWDDIAGLEHAKKCVTEMVIWPLLRPDIFQGCRSPGKGLLLFGPPGTGKTMIGKAIAGEAKATFFSISASSLTSKWIGEGEKLVRALFGVASCRQPAVIFIDEIDSLLSQRKSDGEHESSRRLKTQFLIEMEGCGSGIDQLLLIGATNRPQELDEAARRRLSKRLYIPLPSADARAWIVRNLLKKDGLFTLSEEDISKICAGTEGYSGSDMSNLVKEASMGPLRELLLQGTDINKLRKEEMRPVMLKDFQDALLHVKPSVSQSELGNYEDWNRQFGSHSL
ncbi:hypothetical protein GOP47_0001517 [Adiantum capillus-veneris]|uniref:AAA+ ATPase domain-containing protein n=1 Tax=Adiantum capillus-veneris TaxID=13818 RepID=A0A9D4ZNB7_ADICA|nr:hypothetical protein GOP47_0001517 [Adiantum capillus-veneris]